MGAAEGKTAMVDTSTKKKKKRKDKVRKTGKRRSAYNSRLNHRSIVFFRTLEKGTIVFTSSSYSTRYIQHLFVFLNEHVYYR